MDQLIPLTQKNPNPQGKGCVAVMQDWTLSLIGPVEWGSGKPGEFVANCLLKDDMTWQMEFGALQQESLLALRLQQFVDGFSSTLSSQSSLLEGLPFYVQGLPYFQRMLATGLAVSLQHSIRQTGTERPPDIGTILASSTELRPKVDATTGAPG